MTFRDAQNLKLVSTWWWGPLPLISFLRKDKKLTILHSRENYRRTYTVSVHWIYDTSFAPKIQGCRPYWRRFLVKRVYTLYSCAVRADSKVKFSGFIGLWQVVFYTCFLNYAHLRINIYLAIIRYILYQISVCTSYICVWNRNKAISTATTACLI